MSKEYFEDENCTSIKDKRYFDVWVTYLYMMEIGVDTKDKNVLVLGCGNGELEEKLFWKHKPKNLVLIDFSKRCLDTCRDRLKYGEYIQTDLRNIKRENIKGKFDIVYSVSVMQYLTSKEVIYLNDFLFEILHDKGKIYHFNIPDKSRRFLYRINNVLTMKDGKYFFPKNDFVDKFSIWHNKRNFFHMNMKRTLITPSYNWERFDVIFEK